MFARTALSRGRSLCSRTTQRRNMGGGGPPPPTDGLEGAVRKFLPENHHMAMGIIGFYTTVYMFSKLFSGGKKAPAPVAAAAATSSGDMPSADSAEFGDWLSKENNFEKIFESK